MLPFGSLLTQLPLIIIGALYMLYLGIYAVNRNKEVPIAGDSEKKELSFEPRTEIADNDYFTLVSLSLENISDIIQPDNNSHFIIRCSYLPFRITDFKIVNCCCGNCLFSRPPPSWT